MRSRMFMLIITIGAGCGDRKVGDADASTAAPEWSSCAMKDEVQSCDELCQAEGTTCVANGCSAEPEFCDPEPCDMATQVLALDAEALCADPSGGLFVATTCDAPIDWLFSNTVRCCCATQD